MRRLISFDFLIVLNLSGPVIVNFVINNFQYITVDRLPCSRSWQLRRVGDSNPSTYHRGLAEAVIQDWEDWEELGQDQVTEALAEDLLAAEAVLAVEAVLEAAQVEPISLSCVMKMKTTVMAHTNSGNYNKLVISS